jgi:hypothetical protein
LEGEKERKKEKILSCALIWMNLEEYYAKLNKPAPER